MDTAAELAGRTEANHTHLIAIFLAEEGDGPHLLSFLERGVAMLVERQVLTNHIVDDALHLAQLLVADLLEMREVETQCVGADERAFLLHMVAQHLL